MPSQKIGANDPCWCGSGKKYKRCHRDRQREVPLAQHKIHAEFLRVYNEEYCVHPRAPADCDRGIVRAHSVQRQRQLARIAVRGHVIGPNRSYLNYVKGQPPFVSVGVAEASTYNMLCGKHDSQTFEPIETADLTFEADQCFLFGYRAVCRAVYLVRQRLKTLCLNRQMDRGKTPSEQRRIQEIITELEQAVQVQFAAIQAIKARYDEALLTNNFCQDFGYAWAATEQTPDILGSNLICPRFDFTGHELQPLQIGTTLHCITFSVIATPSGGAVLFHWHRDQDAVCRRFVGSLTKLPTTDIPHAIIRLLFSYCENQFFNPEWWNELEDGMRQSLEERFIRNMREGVIRPRAVLMDDGVRAVNWRVRIVNYGSN